MTMFLLLFSVSFLVALALTPLVRLLALRWGAVDRPGERKLHDAPISRLGGVAVVLATVAGWGLLAAYEAAMGRAVWLAGGALMPILIGGSLLFFIGVWDDLRGVPASVKFLFQAGAALAAIWHGVLIERITLFGSESLELGALALPLTFLWIVGITNAFNLIDGLDGLAAGLATIAAGTCAAIFLLRGDVHDAILLLSLVGALLGFLRYNFNPATIFLGDSGSLVVGFILAVTAVTGSQKSATALAVVIPLLVFGLPIIDTLVSMIRRYVSGLKSLGPYKTSLRQHVAIAKRMFEGDQGHIHHRLIALGWSHRNAVLVLYAIASGFGLLALMSVFAQYRNAGIILLTVGLATYIGLRKLGYEEVRFLKAGTVLRWYEQVSFNRLFFLGFFDLALMTAAYWGAFVLTSHFRWPPAPEAWYLTAYPLVLGLQLGTFAALRLYKGVWRTASIADLVRLVMAVPAAVTLSYIVATALSGPPAEIAAFFVIDGLLLGALVIGSRSTYRVLDYWIQRDRSQGEPAVILGAGRGGQLLLRAMLSDEALGLRPAGFIDDTPGLRGREVNGIPVLGTTDDLPSILATQKPRYMVVSSDASNGDRLDRALAACQERQIPVLRARLELTALDANGEQIASGHRSRPAAYERRRYSRRLEDRLTARAVEEDVKDSA